MIIKQFYFLGYNLPSADHYLFSWLLRSLTENKIGKEKIHIVSKPSPGKREKLETLLEPLVDPKKIWRCGLEQFLEDEIKKLSESN